MKPVQINSRSLGRSSENDLDPPNAKPNKKRLRGSSPRGSSSFDSVELEANNVTFLSESAINVDINNSSTPFTTLLPSVPPPPLPPSPPKAAVCIRNINRPGKPPLKDFSMTVQQGIVYSLVGPAGCGKSTVLSFITGLYEVRGKTTGKVSLLGSSPDNLRNLRGESLQKSVGYMPQEMALNEDLSITETFAFYGRLYGMVRVDVNSRRNFLLDFFGLQVNSKRIGKMSLTDKRILGLAITLLHSPEIIVLDEPYALMDPIAKSTLLDSISKLTSQEIVTFIIATQSVEDASTSNMVGLMRDGRMLTELSPSDLLTRSTSGLFSDAVLNVHKADDSGDTKCPDGSKDDCFEYTGKDQIAPSTCCRPFFLDSSSGKRIQSLLWVSLISLVRNWMLTIFLVVCPTLIILIPRTLFKDDIKPLEMGFVNLENAFLEPCFRPTNLNNETKCDFNRLSCLFLSKLSDSILHLTEYPNGELARDALRNGEIWGFIEFPPKYSAHFQLRNQGKHDSDVLDGSSVFVEMDMTSKQVASTIQSVIYKSYADFSDDLFMACNQNSDAMDFPIKYVNPDGKIHHSIEEFLIPGLLVIAMYFIPMCTFSLQHLSERQNGLMKKARMAGVSFWEVLISAWAKETILTVFRLALCLPIIFLGFEIELSGSLALVVFILALMSLTGVSVGLVIALICDCELYAISFAFVPLVQNLLFSGILWPRELTSTAQFYMSSMLPCTLPADALRSIISRGWSFTCFSVWPGTVYPLLIILLCCGLIYYYERMRSK